MTHQQHIFSPFPLSNILVSDGCSVPSAVPRSEVTKADTFICCQSDQCLERAGAGDMKHLSAAAGTVSLAAWGSWEMAAGHGESAGMNPELIQQMTATARTQAGGETEVGSTRTFTKNIFLVVTNAVVPFKYQKPNSYFLMYHNTFPFFKINQTPCICVRSPLFPGSALPIKMYSCFRRGTRPWNK